MSLLMEALRKAEQAKNQAVGTEGSTVRPVALPVAQGVQVFPDSGSHRVLEVQEPLKSPSFGEDGAIAADLSEPAVIDQGETDQAEDGKAELTLERVGEQEHTQVVDVEMADVMVVDASELPGAFSVAQAVSFPDVVKPGPKREPGKDGTDASVRPVIVSAESSRQTARTVFAAKKEYQRRSRNRRLLVLGIVGGIAGFAVAGFFFFVYRSLISSPIPVVTVEQKSAASVGEGGAKQAPVIAAGNVASALPAEGGAGAVNAAIVGAEAETASQKPVSVSPSSLPQGESRPQGTSALSSLRAMNLVTNVTSTSSVSMPGTMLSPAPPKTNQDAPASPKEAPKVGLSPDSVFEPVPEKPASAPIVITHRPAQPLVSPLLTAAYGAYQKGDFAQAREKYQQVLQTSPKHRGSLLGLAALALQGHEDSLARDLYLRILEQDPGDPLARAGLLAITPTGDPARQESELKLLLVQYPHVAPLFFSLGNLYAAGNHWSEAQQAYFSALQAAKNAAHNPEAVHPDYFFNLAVSLEHLGQLKPAVNYYREALRLAAGQPTGFDVEALRVRLYNLEQGEMP